jgi:hypothetical protein
VAGRLACQVDGEILEAAVEINQDGDALSGMKGVLNVT